jgi:hypothetical protein
MNNTKLEFAQMFQKQGISVIPLRHRGKEPDIATWECYKSILSTNQEIHQWLYSGWNNYGVVAGWKNLAFIDFDDMNTFALWFDWFALLNKHAEVYPMPYIVRTSRGAHVYVRLYGEGANEKRRGLDLKRHGYVVGPGCLHPSGTQYAPITEFRLIDVFDLDTFLPLDLFPRVAPSASCGQIGVFDGVLSTGDYGAVVEDYDPYQMAMFGGQTDLIATVKQRVRIESMFASVRKTSTDGRWLVTLCPFHSDSNPSMWIDTKRQLCGCHTCAMKPMDSINLFARMHNISESAAVSAMAKELGVWG